MQNKPPIEKFQFDDFYYKPSTRRPIYHLLQLNRTVSSTVLDFEEDGSHQTIGDYFNFEDNKYPILRKIFSRYRPSEYTIYHLYIYDRGMDNSRNSNLGKILTNHILYCSSVFEREDIGQSIDVESLEISRKVYEQCIEWIKKTKVLSHLVDDLTEYLRPYCSHEDLSELPLDNEEKRSSFNVDESGIIHLTPRESVTIKKNEAMQVLNSLLAKGPVDFTAFWSDLNYNFRFGEEVIMAPVFYEEFSNKHPRHNFTVNSETRHIVLIRTSKYTVEMLDDYEIVNKTTNENMYSRIIFKKKEKQELEDFFALYKKYLNGLSCNLVFAKCASKLTRVDKLYSKELMFTTTNKSNPKDRIYQKLEHMTNDNNVIEYQEYEHKKSVYNQLNQTLSEAKRIKLFPISEINALSQKKQQIEKWISDFQKTNKLSNFQTKYWSAMSKVRELGEVDNSLNLQHSITDIIQFNLEGGKVPKPLVLTGEAGMGKTITTHQIALNYVNELEHMVEIYEPWNMSNLNLPIFFKAKKMILVDYQDGRFDGSTNLLRGPVDDGWLRNAVTSQFATFPDLEEYISKGEMTKLLIYWSGLSDLHNGNVTYFIDGLDELPDKKSAEAIIRNCLDEKVSKQKPPFLLCSTRPSFYSVVKETIGSDGHNITKLIPKETFSEEELSHDMPNMLCDAWGLNRESAEELRCNLDKYREIIEHPLFVGWICFLIYEGKLEQIKLTSENKEVITNEILDHIINIGIRSSLDRRDTHVRDMSSFEERVREFVALSIHYSIDKPHQVFTKMRHLRVKVDLETRKAIENDCGILFLTGNKIEWTHKRLAEVIYADFMIENKTLLLGPLRVSAPVLARVAQKEFDNGMYNNFDQAIINNWHKHLSTEDFERKIWDEYLFSKSWIYGGPYLIGINARQGILTNLAKNCNEGQLEIAKLYRENLNNSKRFRIHPNFIYVEDIYYNDGEYMTPELNRAISMYLYENSEHIFGNDVIHFDYLNQHDETHLLRLEGNLISAKDLDLSRLNHTVSINEIWRYIYHEALLSNESPQDVQRRIFENKYSNKISRHSREMFDVDWHNLLDFGAIFEDEYSEFEAENQVMEHLNEDPEFRNSDFPSPPSLIWFPELNERFGRIIHEHKISLLTILRAAVVDNAITGLFGDDKHRCVEELWRELYHLDIDLDDDGKVRRNLLSVLLWESSIWCNGLEGEKIENFTKSLDLRNNDTRAIILFPFIHECIKIIGNEDNPYSGKYKFKCDYISSLFTGKNYVRAFELIKDYFPNLESES